MMKKFHRAWIILTLALVSCSVPLSTTQNLVSTLTPASLPSRITPTLALIGSPIPDATVVSITANRVIDADQALVNGDYSQALLLYQQAFESSSIPELKAAALFGTGQVQQMMGDTSTALESLGKSTVQYPTTIAAERAYFLLGQIYSSLQRYTDAASAYRKYLQLRPGIIDSYAEECLGDTLTSNSDFQGANEAYQAAEVAPHLGSNEALEIKVGQNLTQMNDFADAISAFTSIFNSTSDDYTKAEMDLLIGQNEISLENTDQAYTYFQDAVNNYPSSLDSYQALVGLVNAGVTVDDLNRGLVDYFAGQYDVADQAFVRYLANPNSTDKGTAYYYEGLTLRSIGEIKYPLGSDIRASLASQNALTEDNQAISDWQLLIQNYKDNNHWADAWDDISYTQWAYLNQPEQAAQTLLNEVTTSPNSSNVPDLLFSAGRYYERADDLEKAAQTWESIADQFPNSDQTPDAIFFAGISDYRLANYSNAQIDFQKSFVLSTDSSEKARALLWVGKTQSVQKDTINADNSWQEATTLDPTGYYSYRARDLLAGKTTFTTTPTLDLSYDLNAEEVDAESWMRKTFSLSKDTNLSDIGSMSTDVRMIRGQEFWNLGLLNEALTEFEDLQTEVSSDPANTFRLIRFYLDIGFNQQAILASRQVLTLAGMDDAATLTAPAYFNHVRFGLYFQDQILASAKTENIDPILLFSIIRQESLFEGFIQSSAGAVGLMQLMPATAKDVVNNLGWPDNYSDNDLTRPIINIPLGAHYLMQYSDYLNNNLYAILAAYNAGPGNALAWENLSGDDPDLFLEVVRIQETRDYIQGIVENYDIYQQIYSTGP